ncbi:MAG TPA: 4Fe-4S ferredoxin [Deltaproteobacteria bacterium]|nr:4Fe-4S ferredoxin [Deltaproteobacteria bacterium]
MKEPFISLKKTINVLSTTNQPYRELRRHLDKQAVGCPATFSGVELRLLKELFTIDEAKAALLLSYRFEPLDAICARAEEKGYDRKSIVHILESMGKKGCIFVRYKNGEPLYSLHPYAIGMYEMQIRRLTPSFVLDPRRFFLQGYAIEYLTTHVPQVRVIPVDKSVLSLQNVATYDHIRDFVDRAQNRISITDCICKVSTDLLGKPCTVTDRRDVCMGFLDFFDTYSRHGWGRAISKQEAMDILDQNEKDGLVLMTASMQEPQFVCSCCDCCCGIMEMMKLMPRSVDFTASNFSAEVKP